MIRIRHLTLVAGTLGLGAFAALPEMTLKEAFEDDFRMGAAISTGQALGRNPVAMELAAQQFNSISPENLLKWGSGHPRPDQYNFAPVDSFVAFGDRHDMFVVGHTLVWHTQVPQWVFQDDAGQPLTRDALLARMKDHIDTVVGRYRGRIQGWDVVNEALLDDGTLRPTPWLQIIGEDYIEKAFEYAHAADPEAELYYNDYNLWKPAKREGAARIVNNLKARGIPVHGIGMQGHYGIDYPMTDLIEAAIVSFAATGAKVHVTELDIDMLPNPTGRQGADIGDPIPPAEGYDPYAAGLDEAGQQRLAQRYADIFRVFRKYDDEIERVTFWGLGDGDSWFNNWPMRGRTAYPLLFDRQYRPKLALEAVLNTVRLDRD